MRLLARAAGCALTLAAAFPALAAEPVEWDTPVNGVRMALSYAAGDGAIEMAFDYISSAGESLGKYMFRRPSLRAELIPAPGPASPQLKCFPARHIWTGRLMSNVLEIK